MIEGHQVVLEPLTPAHLDGLCAIGLDPSLWEWTIERITDREQMAAYISNASGMPFAVRHRASGRLAGSTRFMNIELSHRRLEIGSTWYGLDFQRTPVNTETKHLLLSHAFDEMRVNRVELKTDALNVRSRAAIARIGAREEGTLRKHMITHSGRVRDTVYFSIVRDEWPAIKERLEGLLARNGVSR